MADQREQAERMAFLMALTENRYDEATHRVYRDWLEERGYDDEALVQRRWTAEWQRSYDEAEAWLTQFARDITEGDEVDWYSPVTLAAVVEAGRYAYEQEGESCLSGMGFTAEGLMNRSEVREAFWKHWQVYTGVTVEKDISNRQVFSCSC